MTGQAEDGDISIAEGPASIREKAQERCFTNWVAGKNLKRTNGG